MSSKPLQREELPRDIEALTDLVMALSARLVWLERQVFGKKSERFVENDPKQMPLFLMPENPAPAEQTQTVEYQRQRPTGRRQLPPNLPRKRVDVPPDETVCDGCGCALKKIGEDITEVLEYQPAQFWVLEYARARMACGSCKSGVQQAELPQGAQVADKARVGAGLLAQIVTSKFADHLPLHRLEGIFERQGVPVPRSSMCNWLSHAADLGGQAYRQIMEQILADGYVHADETPVNYQDEDGRLVKGYLWAVRSGIRPLVAFHFSESRSGEVAEELLGRFKGYIQADDYAGYNRLFVPGSGRIRVGCMAHARRGFEEALLSSSLAKEMLALIRQLYAIEREIKDRPPDRKKEERMKRSAPVLEMVKDRSERWSLSHLPDSPLRRAAGYMSNQWADLTRFLEDGRLRIDNNPVEQQIRPIAVGRKNWLFMGSVEGGRRAARLYTLVQNCKHAGVDPWRYLDSLFRIARMASDELDLTPLAWKTAQAE